jgi:uncharacterized protein
VSEFWDNLISLKPSLSGEQTAGWHPGGAAMSGLGCRLLADRRIPVEGGVHLSADVYVPRTAGRYPAVVQFAAYTPELHSAGIPTGTNEIGSPPVFTDRGYAQVVIVRRGMGRSEGEPGTFFGPQDVEDHESCIAWAAAQPWCDGNVVLFGTSYYGMTQLQVAVRRPPALKAFFCNEICTDYFRQIVQFGGTPALYFMGLWMGANFTERMRRLRVPPLVRALLSHLTNSWLKSIWEPQVLKRVDAIYRRFMRKTPMRPARALYVEWMIDGKTRETSAMPAGPYESLGEIEVPFVVVQNLGYFNLHQFGAYDLFEHAGTLADRKWLILGPARYELPVYAWQLEALAFFDHVLRGADNGYAGQAPVRYWVEGAERYRPAAAFPVPDSMRQRFYLSSGGDDAVSHGMTREAPGDHSSNSWAAIPLGAPVVGGLDAVTNQTLIYDMRVEEDVEYAGPITVHLRFSCNEIDSHVVTRLSRIGADGSFHILSLGTISPARRRLDEARSTSCEIAIDTTKPEPLVPDEPVSLAFSMTPAPTLLRKGETLRFHIASRTDLLKHDVSHGFVHFNLQVPPYFSRNTVHYGPDTYFELHRVAR